MLRIWSIHEDVELVNLPRASHHYASCGPSHVSAPRFTMLIFHRNEMEMSMLDCLEITAGCTLAVSRSSSEVIRFQ